ncbi:DNA glycosylase [Gamsiella multidivaricata]|uniref:DNA glycosylase n=1 Tax=Gamsiella multidivaricata TaxID=101098 RepID=UPI0022209F07|nr:DNA glycosylase [Gamsiella multidivaricata]KAI7832337.1 DNA glycosylase [Gamsiella multidivaricata]
MGSLEAPSGQRPTRRAATKAALAIKSEAQEGDDDAVDNTRTPRSADRDYNAFAEIMSTRAPTANKAPAAAPRSRVKKTIEKKPSPSSSLSSTDVDIINAAVSSELVPDLEDLVADAARVRISGKHSRSYHRFTTLKSQRRVHDDLIAWYDIHHRKLPWRRDFHNPTPPTEEDAPGQRAYEVWVSEIMCQQTQVATVIPYYNTWMAKWPTITDLAAADLEEVNKVWTGLGYYSRASRLHSGAQKVVKDFNGVLPSDPVILEKEVPGIGRYTAGAIVSHAYNVPAELVDGNVIRVLSRLRAIGGDVKGPKVVDLHWLIAKELVHQNRPGCFNQALMELGAKVCTPQNPKCGECPVQTSCRAFAEAVDLKKSRQETIGASQKRSIQREDDDLTDECTLCLPETDAEGKDQGLVTQYPRKAAKKAPRDEECAVSILERVRSDKESGESKSEFLLVKRPDKGLLAGMWEFPTVEQDQLQTDHKQTELSTYSQRSESSRRYLSETLKLDWIKDCKDLQRRDLGSVQHLFSHIRKVYHVEWVLVKDGEDVIRAIKETNEKKKSPTSLETQWLTVQELETAAIPTGINKTFQLLQKYKTGAGKKDLDDGSEGNKRKKTGGPEGGLGKDRKKVKKEEGLSDISKFFKTPPSTGESPFCASKKGTTPFER